MEDKKHSGIQAWLTELTRCSFQERHSHESLMSVEEHYTLDSVVLELSDAQQKALTNIPGDGVTALYLLASYDVPDASHPVSQQSKHGHEQGQDHGAVLGVTIQFL